MKLLDKKKWGSIGGGVIFIFGFFAILIGISFENSKSSYCREHAVKIEVVIDDFFFQKPWRRTSRKVRFRGIDSSDIVGGFESDSLVTGDTTSIWICKYSDLLWVSNDGSIFDVSTIP